MNTARKWLTAAVCLLLATPVFAQPYTISTDGTEVSDSKTGLVWRRCSEGETWSGNTCTGTPNTFTHEQALAQAKTQTGWRLPSVKELASIADRSLDPAIDPSAFPDTINWFYWTSSPFASYAGFAWCVDFGLGLVSNNIRSSTYFVRLVR